MFGRMDAFLDRLKAIKVTAQLSGHSASLSQAFPALGILGWEWHRVSSGQAGAAGTVGPFPAQCPPPALSPLPGWAHPGQAGEHTILWGCSSGLLSCPVLVLQLLHLQPGAGEAR